MRLASPLPRRRGARTCGGGLAKRGIDHVIGIGGNWRRVVADAEEVTAEEVLEQALREPNKASSGETVRFAGALIAGNGRHTTAWCACDDR